MNFDFRSIKPDSIAWRRGGRNGGALAGFADGRRVVIQTPICNCEASSKKPGITTVNMRLFPSDPVHSEFAEWLAGVEDAAEGPWKEGKRCSTSVWNNNFRVTLFADTLVFDESNSLSADVFTARKASALLELTGAWVSQNEETKESKWGLRWKVVQLKFGTESLPEPEGGDCEEPAQDTDANVFAFVED